MKSSSVSSKGQVTIPQEVRVRLGLKVGDRVEFVVEGGKTVLRPMYVRHKRFGDYAGALPQFKTIDEVNSWVREIREDRANRD